MGGYFTKHQAIIGGMGPDPRPPLVYSSLQFLDLVLIRSRVSVNGFGMDSRIASTIRYGSLGLQVPEEQQLPKWDRVGLIQLPSFIEKHEYDADNIEVTEATYFGIQTRTLRQVLDSSLEVCVRSLKVGSQIQREAEEEAKRRQEITDRKGDKKTATTAMASTTVSGADGGGDEKESENTGDDPAEDENNERLEYLQKYYQFTGPVINRAYGQCMDKLESMFRYVMASLKSYELSPLEIDLMNSILDKYMQPFTGMDGQPAVGMPFHSLLPLFREIATSDAQNTFSDAEIFELVGSFTLGDDRVSLSNAGYISKAEFLTQWRASLDRTMPLRKIPREILSGAFVSQALQSMGILPQSENSYYLPMDFAMQEPPPEGWIHTKDDGTLTIKRLHKPNELTPAQIETENRLREELKAKELKQQNQRHQRLASRASFGQAPSSMDLSNAPTSQVRLQPSGASFKVDIGSMEGAAIQRMHAHGVARVGMEHQVLPSPPRMDKEEEIQTR